MLRTPNGPIALHIEVTIGGKPFRQHREKIIDNLTMSPPSSTSADASFGQSEGNSSEVQPTFATRSDLNTRLHNHFQKRKVDPLEARWLLSEWIPGPSVLFLKHGFAAERSRKSPVFTALDIDTNGRLSKDELAASQDRLLSFDRDENGVVELSELAKRSSKHTGTYWFSTELLKQVGGNTSEELIPNNKPITTEQFDALPAIELRASLGKPKSEPPRLELLHVDARITKQSEYAKTLFASEDALVIERPKYRIEIVACQAPTFAESLGQVSVGAVIDGYPIWRALDTDGNTRLERQERSRVNSLLKQRDLNNDGTIGTCRATYTPFGWRSDVDHKSIKN